MKILRPHTGQYLVHVLPDRIDGDLDTVATVSEDGNELTVSIVNRHLYDAKTVELGLDADYAVSSARIVTADDVRTYNTYDEPERIVDRDFTIESADKMTVPPHSVLCVCFTKNK